MNTKDAAAKRAQGLTGGMYGEQGENPFADAESKAIQTQETSGIQSTKSLKVRPMGLEVQAKVDEAEWQEMGERLERADDKLAFRWGDWLNAGNFEWNAYKRFAEKRGRSWRTIEDYAYVCRNVNLSCRHETLSLSHHKVIAPLYDESNKEQSRELQRALLQYAAEKNLSVDEFREAVVKVTEGAPETVSPSLPETVIDTTAIPIVIKPPFYEKPIDRMHREFVKRWKDAKPEDRQAALKRLKALVRELEGME